MGNTLPTDGKFRLISLRYAIDALSPVMSAETLSLHHGKHLQTYVDNLNAAVPGTVWQGKTLEEIVSGSDGALFNAAGQVFNHNMFFGQLRPPREANAPAGPVARLIEEQFGSFEGFRAGFEKAGASLFGSGWVWLSVSGAATLTITQEANAATPLGRGLRPLLTADVWEHAYYVDYRNRRADYLRSLWSVIDWDVVNQRLG